MEQQRTRRSYSVRPYRPGDEAHIVALLQRVFDGWPRFDLLCTPLEHWEWKYLDAPRGAASIWVAEANGEMVGCYHTHSVELQVGDRVFSCTRGYDAATHPGYRGIGISNRLHALRDEAERTRGVAFVPRGPSSEIMADRNRRRHPRFPHEVSVLSRASRQRGLIERARARLGNLYRESRTRLGSRPPLPSRDGVRIWQADRFDERADDFWSAIRTHYRYIVVRDRAWLNWRYCDPRAGDFSVRIAGADDSILGYCVTRTNRFDPDHPTGTVVDLLTLPEHPGVAETLVRDALAFFDEQGIAPIQAWAVRDHPYQRLLRRHGFVASRQPLVHFYKVYDESAVRDALEQVETAPGKAVLFCCGDADWI